MGVWRPSTRCRSSLRGPWYVCTGVPKKCTGRLSLAVRLQMPYVYVAELGGFWLLHVIYNFVRKEMGKPPQQTSAALNASCTCACAFCTTTLTRRAAATRRVQTYDRS